MRKKPRSSRRIAAASTHERSSAVQSPRSRSTRRRSLGSAWAKRTIVRELLVVAARTPGIVVAVLLAPRGVRARRLQMPVGIRADPHVLPGGRDRQLGDPREDLRLVDLAAGVVLVAEAAAAPPAADPGPGAVGAAQAGRHDCVLPLAPGFRLPQACHRSRSRPPSRDRPPSSRSRASSTSPARPRSSRSWPARRAPSSLDLRGLVFMDSSGLRAIAMAAQRARGRRPLVRARRGARRR